MASKTFAYCGAAVAIGFAAFGPITPANGGTRAVEPCSPSQRTNAGGSGS